jgi:hypothetical protein
MMWYPEKAAFRAGRVGRNKDGTQWNAAKVGDYSAAFGVDTKANEFAATAMGSETTASEPSATAMGFETTASGRQATAMGRETTASGRQATAMGESTTASSINTTAMGRGTTASGLRATAMGFGTTAATNQSLTIGECNDKNRGNDDDIPITGPLFVVGNGSYNLGSCSNTSDALVLDQGGNLTVNSSVSAGDGASAGRAGSFLNSDGNGLSGSTLRAENKSTGNGVAAEFVTQGTDVTLALFSDGSGPILKGFGSDGGNSDVVLRDDGSIETYDGSNRTVNIDATTGDISIDGTLDNSGADFAEELPVARGAAVPEAGDLVGVRGGEVSLTTEEADRVMIASTAPAVTGNVPPAGEADDARRVPVAFVGQVPARVRGSVEVGDLIVPSGRDDGTARAVPPEEYRRAEHGPIAGQAWSEKETAPVGTVTVAVGLGQSGAVAERMDDQRDRIATLEAENEALKERQEVIEERLAALEARASGGSIVAGLPGEGLLAVLIGLGGLGAGLLWRRRA